MQKNLTIFHKGLFLIAVPLFLQIAFLIYLAIEQNHSVREQEMALRSKEVVTAADRLERTMAEANSAIRSYALTGDEAHLAQFRNELAQIDSRVELTRQLIEDPNQNARFMEVTSAIAAARPALEEAAAIIQAQRRSGTFTNFNRPELMDPFALARPLLDEFRAAEKALDRFHIMTVRGTSRRIVWVLSIGLALAFLATLVSLGIFSRHFTHRLVRLSENVDLFLRGKKLPPPMKGTDEISRMDHIFQAMASSISASAKKEEKYKKSLEKRAAALGEANAELKQKSEENEMFVYSVSHDLRSPLVNLQGFSRELGLVTDDLHKLLQQPEVPPAIREQAGQMIAGDMSESLDFIRSGVTRLANIIDALLRLSRVGRVEYVPQVVSLDAMVRSVASTLESTRAEKGATIIIHPLPDAWIDPSAAEQIIANCLGNALNYLDPDRPGQIEVGSLANTGDTGRIIIFFKDNGLGIAEAYLPKVFMVFQRLHGKAAPGEGIGLALVRRVLECNDGRIWVESQPDEGSTFFIDLPSVTRSRDEVNDTAELPLFTK